MRGHTAPARAVARLRPEDHALGVTTGDGARLCRCLRCDAWVRTTPPTNARREVLGGGASLPRPRRGRVLDDAILLRVIALERAAHAVVFGLLSLGLVAAELGLPWLQRQAQDVVAQTGRSASHEWLVEQIERLADVSPTTITVLLVVSLAYFLVEGIEAIGLWRERRWAEYLTVLATAGFLPFEVRELLEGVSVLRVGALVVNLAILFYLVWSKRLFGLRGGTPALVADQERSVDWDDLLAHPPERTP